MKSSRCFDLVSAGDEETLEERNTKGSSKGKTHSQHNSKSFPYRGSGSTLAFFYSFCVCLSSQMSVCPPSQTSAHVWTPRAPWYGSASSHETQTESLYVSHVEMGSVGSRGGACLVKSVPQTLTLQVSRSPHQRGLAALIFSFFPDTCEQVSAEMMHRVTLGLWHPVRRTQSPTQAGRVWDGW